MLVRGHLHASVPRQRTAEGDWQTSHLGNQGIHHTGPVFPSHFDQKGKVGLPFDKCGDVGVVRPRHQIPILVSGNRTIIHVCWALSYGDSIHYTPPWLSLRRGALGSPYPPPRSQMPCQFFLEDATGLNEQALIDGFVGHLHLLIIRKRPPQLAGDLFGRLQKWTPISRQLAK